MPRHLITILLLSLSLLFSYNQTKAQTGALPGTSIPAQATHVETSSTPKHAQSNQSNQSTPKISQGITFTENKGQLSDSKNQPRSDILFKGQAAGADIYLRKTGFSCVVSNVTELLNQQKDRKEAFREASNIPASTEEFQLKGQRVDVDFVNCNPDASINTGSPAQGYTNYYYPNCPQGVTHVNSFKEITVKNIYPNTDVKYYTEKQQNLKYDIIVNPGGDPAEIVLKYSGAEELKVENGKLKISTTLGEMGEYLPRVYQQINSKIVDVKAAYVLKKANPNPKLRTTDYEVTFQLGNYQTAYPLTIDPAWWSTYCGGNMADAGIAVTVDSKKSVIITGYTDSGDFPYTAGAYQTVYKGALGIGDVFVAKFDSMGALKWATYYGGYSDEMGNGITTDPSDDYIAVTGCTLSSDFPVTATAFQSVYGGPVPTGGNETGDAFVLKFDPTGIRQWGTFYGASGDESGNGICVDKAGNIVIAGFSGYAPPLSPTLTVKNAYQSLPQGQRDVLIASFNSTGTALQWATYYGGTMDDIAEGVAVDAANNVVVTGLTSSLNFPVSAAAYQPVMGAGASYNAFLLKFGNTGTRQWATYYGGSTGEEGYGIAVDAANDIVIVGQSASTDLPVSANAYQPTFTAPGFNIEGFITQFNSAGNFVWGTYEYLGRSDLGCTAVDIDENNNIYVLDQTTNEFGHSGTAPAPVTTCTFDPKFNPGSVNSLGAEDMYVIKFDSAGNYYCATYIGGSGEEDDGAAKNITVKKGVLAVTGYTTGGFPMSSHPFQSSMGGPGATENAFVISLCSFDCGDTVRQNLNFKASSTNLCSGQSVNFASTYTACDTVDLNYFWTFPGGTPSSSTAKRPLNIMYKTNGQYDVKLIIQTPCGTDSLRIKNYITVNGLTLTFNPTNASCKLSDGNAIVSATGGSGTYTYSWETGPPGQTYSGLSAGIYTVSVNDSQNCTQTGTVTINSKGGPAISNLQPVAELCKGGTNGSATLNISGGSPGYTYSWSNGVNDLSTSPQSAISSLSAGNYNVTITDAAGCQIIATTNVSEPSAISYTLTPTNSTCGLNNGAASIVASGGNSPISFLWPNGSSAPSVSALDSGNYTLTITNSSGCDTIAAFSISSTGPTVIMNVTKNNCGSQTSAGAITLTTTGTILAYSWSNGATTPSLSGLSSGTYSVTVTDASGCTAETSAGIALFSDPIPVAGTDATISQGQSILLTASGGITYQWSPAGSLNNASSSNPLATPLQTTQYTVTVTDDNHCSATDSVLIIVTSCESSILYLPNAFSPNGDNKNDQLYLHGQTCVAQLHLIIYDRWGEDVFETNNPDFSWDGTFNGKTEDSGVFTYYLSGTLNNGKAFTKKGNITLLR